MLTTLLALHTIAKVKLGLVFALVECRLVLMHATLDHAPVFLGVVMHRAAPSITRAAYQLVRLGALVRPLVCMRMGHSVTPSH
jgi:hypothetical protein